ncbi:MAG: ATP-binding protein, partial [Planctomycetaceae bacterium]|nr:ATP-binding protein [Planctomycetaceae bacterium]
MYQAYWGLSQSPFTPAAGRKLVDQHPLCSEALARLDFLVENRSRFGLLAGPAGSGKSLVLGEFTRRQRAAGSAVALVSARGLSPSEMLLEAAAAWGCAPCSLADAGPLWRLAVDRLAELRLEQVPAVLAIDDLDGAGSDTRLLVERLLHLADTELTVVAAAGDESLMRLGKRLLDLAELRIELALWTAEETGDYLKASL